MWFWNILPATSLFMPFFKEHVPNAKLLIMSDDAHTLRKQKLGEEALARHSSNRLEKIKLEADVYSVFVKEYQAYQNSDSVMTITSKDLESIISFRARDNFKLISIPGDEAYDLTDKHINKFSIVKYALSNENILSSTSLDGRDQCIVFVGNGANPTNQAAMRWFLSEIMDPLFAELEQEFGPQTFEIIGAEWEGLLEPFISMNPRIINRGLLDESDVFSILDRCKVFVSPITPASTGLNTKNVLALSRGIPLVTTTNGADGLFIERVEGKNSPFFIADQSKDFIRDVVALYHNKDLWMATSSAALKHAHEYFSTFAQAEDLERIMLPFSLASQSNFVHFIPNESGGAVRDA